VDGSNEFWRNAQPKVACAPAPVQKREIERDPVCVRERGGEIERWGERAREVERDRDRERLFSS